MSPELLCACIWSILTPSVSCCVTCTELNTVNSGMTIPSLTVLVLVCGHYTIQSTIRKKRAFFTMLTVVHTDRVAVVCTDKGYITVTPIAQLNWPGIE